MAVQIQYRRGEAAEWTAVNPTLAIGEPGYEVDTGRIKIGDGVTAWNDLVYTAANSLLSGDGPPDNVTDGKIGDFYIDTLNQSIYGPKTETGWGTGTDFVVSLIDQLVDVDTTTDPPEEGEALIWNPTGGNGTGAWVPGPAGAEAFGTIGQIQYNDGASPVPGLTASADLTWDDTAKELGVNGDINLDDGVVGPVTTLQTITPTQDNTISLPNATGTLALVAGSSGQLVYNNAGAYAGASNTSVGASGDITLSANGAASTGTGSAFKLTGDWFVGVDPVPQALIQPAGTATSTTWSTSGTGLGINAPSTFNGNLLDLQVDGTSQFRVQSGTGNIGIAFVDQLQANTTTGAGSYLRFYGGANKYLFEAVAAGGTFLTYDQGLTALSFGVTQTFSWGSGSVVLARDANDILAQRRGTNAQTYRLYNTYTDASNYERGFVRWNANQFEIGTEAAGTGDTFRQLALYSQGGQRMLLGSDTSIITSKLKVNAYFVNNGTGGWLLPFGSNNSANTTSFGVLTSTNFASTANGQFVWTTTNYGTNQSSPTVDTGIARDSAGVVAITDGSTGTGYLKTTPVAVSALPAAATVGAGTRGFVSDSTVAASGNFGATVIGGGSNNVPVFSDGTNWLIG